jgi:PAS domain S-box-containing protein
MREEDKIQELQKERDYFAARLEEVSKELAKLDLLNLTLTQQKRQTIAAFNFIRIMQEKLEEAFTVDDLYSNIVKALTTDLFMDSSALLRVDFNTRNIFILSSSGLPENLVSLKLDDNISKQEVIKPTFVSSSSSLQAFHKFVIKSFTFPYFVWRPIVDEEGGLIVLFVGNRFEDLVSKQPFSEASLETFGAISSVISLRRANIANIQERLRRKREKIDFLAEVLKASPIAVIAMDWNGKIEYINPATEKLYGYREEVLLGKDPGMLNAESNACEIQKEIEDTVRRGKIWRGEILNRKKNGDLFYIYASIYPVMGKGGNFIPSVSFHEDITERKRAEDALWESEERFRAIFNSAQDCIFIKDRSLRYLLVNPSIERLFGARASELIGKTDEELFGEETGKHIRDIDSRVLKGEIVEGEHTKPIKGVLRTFHHIKVPVRDSKGEIIGICGIARDITERKQAEESLRVSEKKYRDLVDNALVGIYKTNLKGDILYVNEALSKMLEFGSPEEMIAENVLIRYKNTKDRDVLIEYLMSKEKVDNFEVELLTKTGKTKDVLLSATLEGDILSGMVMDITESKQAENERERLFKQVYESQEKLQNLSRRLVEVQEADRRFLASELHDQVGQNLTALSINLNIIQGQFSDTLDKKVIDRLDDSLKLVEETIERIRDVMSGLRPPVLDDYGLGVALRWYSERFSKRSGISTKLQVEESIYRLPPAVETALFRIFQEVLTNVAKHARARHVNAVLKEIDSLVQLTITDDGVGFNPSDTRRLKEKLGWGLITIEERARALGGHLFMESAPGKGTQVIVKVPR